MAAAALLPGTGSTALWGFSKALDLQDPDAVLPEKDKAGIAAADAQPEPESSECLDILLVGASDIRHVFKTLARAWRHPARPLHASRAPWLQIGKPLAAH
nr:hypothetical protein HK105_003587 [Polyrhizophydium stewartii]